jgi:oligopeptidase B
MGRHWYDGGKLLNKINTFTDFVACAGHLRPVAGRARTAWSRVAARLAGCSSGLRSTWLPTRSGAVAAQVPSSMR